MVFNAAQNNVAQRSQILQIQKNTTACLRRRVKHGGPRWGEEGIRVSMCCLGALGPWSPLSDVCPRVFPALTVHWHLTGSTTHRASLQICQMTAVWSKNWEAPGHLCYYYPHTQQHWVCVTHLSNCLSPHLSPIISEEASESFEWLSHRYKCLCFHCGDSRSIWIARLAGARLLNCWAKTNWCPVSQLKTLGGTEIDAVEYFKEKDDSRLGRIHVTGDWRQNFKNEWRAVDAAACNLLAVLRSYTLSAQAWEHLFCLRTKLI